MNQDLQTIKDLLQRALDRKNKSTEAEIRSKLMTGIGADIVAALTPLLAKLSSSKSDLASEITKAFEKVKINISIPEPKEPRIPDIKLPEFPKIPAPIVNYKAPDIHIPEFPAEMDIRGWVNLMGFDKGLLLNPLPVQLRDASGNPIKLMEILAALSQSGGKGSGAAMGSGKIDYFTIKALLDGSGNPYNSANPFPVTITSGASATSASALVDSTGVQYSGSNPLPVTIVSGGTSTSASNIVDSSGVAYSGSNPIPTYMATAPTFTSAVALVDSSGVQYSGVNPVPMTIAVGSNATVAAFNVDSSGVGYSGSNPIPIYQATQPTFTSAVVLEDSSGVQYSGSNPIPVTVISGALTSSIAVGPSTVGVADDGAAPLQQGGVGRTSNPSKVTDGQIVKASFDVIGRQVIRPLQVRGLIQTAYVQITGGTETTLRAGVAGAYLDLIYLLAANNSDAAVSIDIRAVTGGAVVMTLQVPANGVSGISLPVPIPQQDTGNNWTVDGPDISGTTVSFSALFSQEV